jgi:hypothetical protein
MDSVDVLYYKYEYLAKRYSKRIFNYNEISLEYKDLLQDFKLKIFNSIKTYGKRWLYYRNTGTCKPVPIKFYLESACKKHSLSIIHEIQKLNNKVSIDNIDYDWGYNNEINYTTNTEISKVVEPNIIVKGINLCEGLKEVDNYVFNMYLSGYKTKEIVNGVMKNYNQNMKESNVRNIVNSQKHYIQENYYTELLSSNQKYVSYKMEQNA